MIGVSIFGTFVALFVVLKPPIKSSDIWQPQRYEMEPNDFENIINSKIISIETRLSVNG